MKQPYFWTNTTIYLYFFYHSLGNHVVLNSNPNIYSPSFRSMGERDQLIYTFKTFLLHVEILTARGKCN